MVETQGAWSGVVLSNEVRCDTISTLQNHQHSLRSGVHAPGSIVTYQSNPFKTTHTDKSPYFILPLIPLDASARDHTGGCFDTIAVISSGGETSGWAYILGISECLEQSCVFLDTFESAK